MKKVTLFMAIIAIMSLASCSKDRTCTCTYTSTETGWTASASDVTVVEYTKSKKKDARENCMSEVHKHAAVAASGGSPAVAAYDETWKCELK